MTHVVEDGVIRVYGHCKSSHAEEKQTLGGSVFATWLMCMLLSQVKGLAEVRSLEPRTVDMIPF